MCVNTQVVQLGHDRKTKERLGYKPGLSPVRSNTRSIAESPVNADIPCKKLSTIHRCNRILCFFALLIFYQRITLNKKKKKWVK